MSLRAVAATAAIPSVPVAPYFSSLTHPSWDSSPISHEFGMPLFAHVTEGASSTVSLFAERPGFAFEAELAVANDDDHPLLLAGAEEIVAVEGGRKFIPMPKMFFDALREQLIKTRGTDEDWDREDELVDAMDRMEKEWNDGLKNAGKSPSTTPVPKSLTRKEKLAPLHEIFLKDDVMDRAIMATGIPEILDGKGSKNNGAIFNGPPGTGKTVMLRALAKVYENCGAYAVEVSEAAISDKFVGSKAQNLDKIIQKALEEARKRGKPSFIYLDEASTSVSKPEDGSNVKGYYQEALDTLKRYIGNYPELVFAISTNAGDEVLDDALVREGRLRVIRVDKPDIGQKTRMWSHFLKKFGVIEGLSHEQYETLAKTLPEESQGAAIELFCRTYLDTLILAERKRRNQSNLLFALEADAVVTVDDVKPLISYERLLEDLRAVASLKATEKAEKPRRYVGFDRPENAEMDRKLAEKRAQKSAA